MVQGYCLKEKKKVQIKDPKYELNKLGRPVARGTCPSCGGTIYKILKADEVPADLKAKAGKKGGARKSKASRKSGSRKSKSRKSKGSRKSRKSKKSRK